MNRDQLLERLNSLCPIILYPTMTDMGLECTIATKEGIVYPILGMLLFCGGNWPIRKLFPADKGFRQETNTFCLSTSEEEATIFSKIGQLESAFLDLFNIDSRWEEMEDDELSNWLKAIRSDGMSIIKMSDIWENEISDTEE